MIQKIKSQTNQKEKLKVLVIGLDGVSWSYIESLMKEGKLPNFKRIMDNGVSGKLRSIIPPTTPPAWASFMTGKNPGKHGIFGFGRRKTGTYEMTIENASNMDGKTLWRILSDHGKKVVVINVPMTYPLEKVNGILISGYMAPPDSIIAYPHQLKKELMEEVPGYRVYLKENDPFGKDKKSMDNWLKDLYFVTRKITQATLYLSNRIEWDSLIVVFSGPDWVSHVFWRYMDPLCVGYNQYMAREYGTAVVEYYQEIDTIIGRLTELLDENDILIIMSDHGNGPVYKIFYINEWLMKNGFLKLGTENAKPSIRNVRFWLSKIGLRIEKLLMFLVAHPRILKAVKLFWNATQMKFSILDNIDWSHTVAYGCEHGIFINVKGRDPQGIVEPGLEYENLRNFLIKKLSAIKDQSSRKKIFEIVAKREEIYVGPHVCEAPDIIILTKSPYSFSRGIEIRRKIVRSEINVLPGPLQSSRHEIDGLFMAMGNHIKKGIRADNALLIDLAPTILHIFGVPLPSNSDGRVLKHIFEPSSPFAERQPEYAVYEESIRTQVRTTEEEALKKRLKELGYLQ